MSFVETHRRPPFPFLLHLGDSMMRPTLALTLFLPALLLPAASAETPDAPNAQPDPCGLVSDPTCWSMTFACYWIHGPMSVVFPKAYCPLQPGCCVGAAGWEANESSTIRFSTCENYGVDVNLVVVGTSCPGSCENYGVEVNVVADGSHCSGACQNQGVIVSVGETCQQDGIYACFQDVCTQPCGGGGCMAVGSSTRVPTCEGSLAPACHCAGSVSIAMGLASCVGDCQSNLLTVVVGIMDCGSCSANGFAVIVGFYCDQAGVGYCVHGQCTWVVDRNNTAVEANLRPMFLMNP